MIIISIEKEFYSKKFQTIRLQHYKDAYDQGRFDEDFERTYKLGRYAEEGEDGLDNPNFEKVNL